MKYKRIISAAAAVWLFLSNIPRMEAQEEKTIKWVDFTVTSEALRDAMDADIESRGDADWITLLAVLAARYGGDFSFYRKTDLTALLERHRAGEAFSEMTSNDKLFNYYIRAYSAVLGGMLGPYTEISSEGTSAEGYGLTAFSPIAQGYYFSHFDDFGASRSYGYRRKHLGHDLMGSVGTPVIAVEAGYVEACGWNQYGGWRIGIRSFDGKRYYYYAHLRKGHPFCDMYEGKIVDAGEVIGYLGMTGYSKKEDTNNIDTPHLHYGMQLILEPSQKDGTNQIWIDMYELTKFLSANKSRVIRSENGEYRALRVRIPADSHD